VSGPRAVSASVRFAQPVRAGCTVHVMVEDISRADAAAPVVAEAVEPLARAFAAGQRLDVTLMVPDVDDRARYNVRVHVACSGSGVLSAGDHITTRSYPVLTHGATDHVDVEVVAI
jgi:hypothetical protein